MKLVISSQGPHWKLIYQDNPHIDELRDSIEEDPYLDDVDVYVEDKICPMVVRTDAKTRHAITILEEWAGFEIIDKSYYYKVTKKEQEWAKEFVGKFKSKKVVGIVLKASSFIRTWSILEIKRLIKLLLFNDIHIILFDNNPINFNGNNITNMCGGYNIREVASVIQQLDLLLTPDSGLLHFGGHFKIPTISIWGGTDPSTRIKYYTSVKAILGAKRYNCWPCFLHTVQCPKGMPAPCIDQISAEDVFKQVKEYSFNR
jgi:ADP-heptose:LPS heptosyltransferase